MGQNIKEKNLAYLEEIYKMICNTFTKEDSIKLKGVAIIFEESAKSFYSNTCICCKINQIFDICSVTL